MSEGEEEYSDAMSYLVTDEFGNIRLKDDNLANPQNDRRMEDPHPLEWVKYVAYIWAIRLSLSTLGSLFPVLMGYWSVFAVGVPAAPNAAYNVTAFDWNSLQQPGEFASTLRSSIMPIKLTNIPTISSTTSKILLKSLYLSHSLQLKVQYNNSRYVYFDENRLWSDEFSALRTYSYLSLSQFLDSPPVMSCAGSDDNRGVCTNMADNSIFPVYEYIDFMRENVKIANSGQKSNNNMGSIYIYSSFPELLPYLEVFAPHLVSAFAASLWHINSAQLWLNSRDVQAGFHYDTQDNLLYQLSGEKTVYVILQPNHSSIHTYPSFHPYYRQGFMVNSSINNVSHVYGLEMRGEIGSVLQVTLRKGEAIYIPKGYLHSVATSSSDSLSVNTWLHSQADADWAAKLDSFAWPFRFIASKAGRLARVGAIAREVSRVLYGHGVVLGGDSGDVSHGLARELMARMVGPLLEYQQLKGIDGQDGRLLEELSCSEQDSIKAELDAAVKRTASSLAHSAIHFLPSLGIEMLRLSLVDFMEASCLAAMRYEDDAEDGYDDNMSDSMSASDGEYQRALQEVILSARKSGGANTDHLLLLQHPAVFTLGRGADTSNIKFTDSDGYGKAVYKIERGGDVTWHGPGQLVAYPILDLHHHKKDLHWYVRSLEQIVIDVLAEYGVSGQRDPINSGVFVQKKKIAAVGMIVPCGIQAEGYGVCKLESLTQQPVSVDAVSRLLLEKFKKQFNVELSEENTSFDDVDHLVSLHASALAENVPKRVNLS
eukprot:gene25595-30909_t